MRYELINGTPAEVAEELNERVGATLEDLKILDDGRQMIAIVGESDNVSVELPRIYSVDDYDYSLTAQDLIGQGLPVRASTYALTRNGVKLVAFFEELVSDFTEEEAAEAVADFSVSINYVASTRVITITDAEFPEFPVYIMNEDNSEHYKFDSLQDVIDNFEYVLPENAGNVNLQFSTKNFMGSASFGFDLEQNYSGTGGNIGNQLTPYRELDTYNGYTPNYYAYFNPHTITVQIGNFRQINRILDELPDVDGVSFTIELARDNPAFYVITMRVPDVGGGQA